MNLKSGDCEVSVNWITSSEKSNQGFVIERSVNGLNYTEVARIKSKNNFLGNEGLNHTILNVEGLPSGVYQIILEGELAKRLIKRFVKAE